MNFSKNNKLSKVLSLILVCVMIVTVFAGCKKEEPAPETTDPSLDLNLNLTGTNPPEETQAETTEATEPNDKMGTVTQQMNIRSQPAMQSVVLGTLFAGDRLEIIRQASYAGNTWGYIREPEEGWVVMDYVEMDVPTTVEPDPNETPGATGPAPTSPSEGSTVTINGTKGVITGNNVNIRSEASTNGKIEGSYGKGDVVLILETKNGWGRTDKGWVKMDFVNLSGNNAGNTGNTGNAGNNNTTGNNNNITSNGSTNVVAKGVVRVAELNIRASYSTNSDRLGSYNYGARVEIFEKSNGWGRTNKGWIHMDYIYQDGTTGTNTDNGTVTGQGLNIRSGPGTNYDSLGSYSSGDRVKILEQFTYGNTTWGCTNKGWISLDYVDLDSDGNDTNNNNNTNNSRVGTITSGLNIRSGAGTNYEIVGTYEAGDTVTILRTQNGWGQTSQGWISLNYVDFGDDDDNGTRTGTVTRNLNIREGAGTEYEIVGGLEAGEEVTILDIQDGWGRIDGGWISLNYVDLD